MDREGWNRRYETTDLVSTTEPDQFLVAEVELSSPETVAARVRARRPGKR